MPGLLGVSSVLSIQNLRKKTAESRSWGVGLDRALRRFLSFSASYSHQFIRFFYQILAYFLRLFRTPQQALRQYSLSMPLRFPGVYRFLDHWGHIAFPDARVWSACAGAVFPPLSPAARRSSGWNQFRGSAHLHPISHSVRDFCAVSRGARDAELRVRLELRKSRCESADRDCWTVDFPA